MRATASRTAATLGREQGLIDHRRGRPGGACQDATCEQFFERLKIEILEHGLHEARLERRRGAHAHRTPVTKDPIREARRRLIEQDEIDGAPGGLLQASRQGPDVHRLEVRPLDEPDGHVHIAVRVGLSPGGRPEHERVGNARVRL